jgi:hypothetical protein
MKNEENIIRMLKSKEFNLPYKVYEELKEKKEVSDKVLKEILELSDNRLFQGDFLEKFEYFTPLQLQIIEQFINKNIYNKNCLFVSSLIECANFNNILSIYDICLEFIKKRRNNFIVLSALDYVFEHMNFHNIDKTVATFNRVLNNKRYYQNCQTIASLYLFRITHHQKYYDFLKSLVIEGNEINHIVLKNNLQGMDYNKRKYFAYFDDLMILINDREKISSANNAVKSKREVRISDNN